MKHCSYCGHENLDDAIHCCECGTLEFKAPEAAVSPPHVMEFFVPSQEEMKNDFVTLMTCRTLAEADLIVCELRGAGITAVIPDEFLMQAICFNLNTYGYVRVQVAPKDYEAAKEVLSVIEPETPDQAYQAPT